MNILNLYVSCTTFCHFKNYLNSCFHTFITQVLKGLAALENPFKLMPWMFRRTPGLYLMIIHKITVIMKDNCVADIKEMKYIFRQLHREQQYTIYIYISSIVLVNLTTKNGSSILFEQLNNITGCLSLDFTLASIYIIFIWAL